MVERPGRQAAIAVPAPQTYMKTLDLKLRVTGHASISGSTKEALWETDAFRPLPHSTQRKWLTMVPPAVWFSAEVQGSAVFISEDWVVSIYGKRLINCVAAMSTLLSTISHELGAPVAVSLLTPSIERDEPFHRVLKREASRNFIVGALKWGTTILVSGAAGALIQWFLLGSVPQ